MDKLEPTYIEQDGAIPAHWLVEYRDERFSFPIRKLFRTKERALRLISKLNRTAKGVK